MVPFLKVILVIPKRKSSVLRFIFKVFGQEDPSILLGWNIPSDRQQLIASLMVLGAFVSSSSAGFTAKYVGRKLSLWIACIGVFASTALMQATTNIGGLYAGRLILGLANGLLMTHSQLYGTLNNLISCILKLGILYVF